jgi:hypothetical protein
LEDSCIGEGQLDRGRFPDLRLGLPDDPTGDPLISLDAVGRFTRHDDQLLPYTLKKDRYPDPGDGNGALDLVTGEFFKRARVFDRILALFFFSLASTFAWPCLDKV